MFEYILQNTKKFYQQLVMKYTRKKRRRGGKGTRKNIRQPIRAAIIPHAGKKYAGEARKSVFKLMNKQTKYIIYIATVHRPEQSKTVYTLSNSSFTLPATIPHVAIPYNEHSYKWVAPELRHYFPTAQILAIGPNQYSSKLCDWIVQFMKKHKKCILLATTDLIHYGKSFHNMNLLDFPQQLSKQKKEENFINALVKNPIKPKQIRRFTQQHHLMCGPNAIDLFAHIIKKLHYSGKVVDYYDSHGSTSSDRLNRYIIDHLPVHHLVSYVSIVYGTHLHQQHINHFDIMMAIAALKSNLLSDVYKKHYKVYLPTWSPFYRKKQGVFVGTSIHGKTNCSYGRYENHSSTATKITEAALDCPKDAANRWTIPYTKDTMDDIKYKVELLESKKKWKRTKHILKFPLDGKHGMYLTLPQGGSATYLPVVARDHKWTIENYLRSLAKKAGGRGDEWKNPHAVAKVYTSKSYTWDPHKQKLEIF